jgi:translocation and assembly module TamB
MARRRRFDDADEEDEAFDVDDVLDALRSSRRRPERPPPLPRPRRRLLLTTLLAGLVAGVWFAPAIVARTELRDLPLRSIFAGIDGTIESSAARWDWFDGVVYENVVLRDRSGRAVALVPHVALDRGLVRLALTRRDLGTLRLTAPEVLVEVRQGGSSLEDVLAPWLARAAAGGPLPTLGVEVVAGRATLVDLEHADGWRLDGLFATATLDAAGSPAAWTFAGQVHRAAHGVPEPLPGQRPAVVAALDRTTLAAEATAVLARDGGFSISCPPPTAGPPRITANAHGLPLGISAVLATRFAGAEFLSGRGDVRVELVLDAAEPRAAGVLMLDQAALREAGTAAELLVVGTCELPFDVELSGGRVAIRRLAAVSPLLRAEASGVVSLPDGDAWEWARALVEDDFSVTAEVDLTALAGALPSGLAVRPDVRVTGGRLGFTAAAHADGAERVLEVRLAARDLAGTRTALVAAGSAPGAAPPAITVEERPITWAEPFSAWLRGRLPPGRRGVFRIDEARLTSAAVEASASGTATDARLQWTADLGMLFAGVAALVDVGGASLAGTSRGAIDLESDARGETSLLRATVGLADLGLVTAGRPPWRDAEIRLEAEATGRLSGGAAMVERAGLKVSAATDTLEAGLVGGVIVDLATMIGLADGTTWLRPGPTSQAIVAEGSLAGDLGRWHARLAPLAPAPPAAVVLGGRVTAAATVAAQDDAWRITKAGGEVERFSLTWGGRVIAEPRIIATAAGLLDPSRGRYEVSSGEVLTPTLSLRTGGLAWTPRGPARIDQVRGKLQWQADVGRLTRWLVPPEALADWPATGRAWGTLEAADAQGETLLLVDATGSQLALAGRAAPAAPGGPPPAAAPPPVWLEPQAALSLELALAGGADSGARINRLALESSTLALAATGSVGPAANRRLLDLGGTVAWDWEQVSRLLLPWTKGTVRLAGGGTRPFTLRSPLLPAPETVEPPVAPTTEAGTVMLPESWLRATLGTDAETPRTARLTRPVATAAAPAPPTVDRLRETALDTSIAWQAAEVGGLALIAGELPLRLVEGQLACGPFDLGAAGGRIRGAPWISFRETPWEVVVPPGRIVERVSLTDARVQQWVGRLSPLLGRTTRTTGFVTIDCAGGRLPLLDPLAGEAGGQVVFEQLEVTPSGGLEPLINLLVRLQAAADPRFALGDRAVLLRVRPEPVRFALSGGRLQHDGLVMDTGPLVVRSGGSVAADGSLAMVVEVALRAEAAGSVPVIAPLLRTPLVIPLKGTLERPQFDARTIDLVVARIVDNTAEAVLRDGLGRGLQGLETLFGNPPPPEPPLTLPPVR